MLSIIHTGRQMQNLTYLKQVSPETVHAVHSSDDDDDDTVVKVQCKNMENRWCCT